MADRNRVKRLLVPYSEVADFVLTRSGSAPDWPEQIRVTNYSVPAGTKVLAVKEDLRNRSFEFLLQNDSWPEVAPFDTVPETGEHCGVPYTRVYYRDQVAPVPEKTAAQAAGELVEALRTLGYEAAGRALTPTEWTVSYQETPYTRTLYDLHPDGKVFRTTFDTATGGRMSGPTFIKRWK